MHLRHWFITDTKSLRMVGVAIRREMRMVDPEKSRVIDVAIFAVVQVGYMCGISRYFQWPFWLKFNQNFFMRVWNDMWNLFDIAGNFFGERMKMTLNDVKQSRSTFSALRRQLLCNIGSSVRKRYLQTRGIKISLWYLWWVPSNNIMVQVSQKCIKCSCFFLEQPSYI